MSSEFYLTFPITAEMRDRASQFANPVRQYPGKSERIYRNTIAVSFTHYYLSEFLGLEIDLTASASWDLASRLVLDVADIVIPQFGTLECRAVGPDRPEQLVLEDVQTDRKGYLVIELNQDYTEGKIIGFTPTLDATEPDRLSLSRLQPIDRLLDAIETAITPSISIGDTVNQLGNLTDTPEMGIWKKLRDFSLDLANRLQAELASPSLSLQVRSRVPEEPLLSDDAIAKPIPIGSDLVLVIDRVPQANAPEDEEIAMCIIVCSVEQQRTLPAGIQMTVSDGQNSEVVSQIPGAPILIQRFTGKTGEAFQISIMCDGAEYSKSLHI